MIVIPAVDLSGGHAVQWVGGRAASERVRLPGPRAVAARFRDVGFSWLHVVDLDAALGRGDNTRVVERLLAERRDTRVQVGGGVRDEAAVERLLAAGADRVVVGTRAVRDRSWLRRVAEASPGRVVVAADARGGSITAAGWTADEGLMAESFLESLAGLPLAAVLVTDVDREGSQSGADETWFRRMSDVCPHPLIAAGGVAHAGDLRRLESAGVAAVVVGMALYTGALNVRALAREFGGEDGPPTRPAPPLKGDDA